MAKRETSHSPCVSAARAISDMVEVSVAKEKVGAALAGRGGKEGRRDHAGSPPGRGPIQNQISYQEISYQVV